MNRVTLGRIIRPRGIKGEVILEGSDRDPREFLAFHRLAIHPGDQPVTVEHAFRHDGRIVLKLQGVNSIEEAERLRGRDLTLPEEDRPPAPDGEFYFSDLIGCMVIEQPTGVELGRVEDCLDYGGPVLLQVMQGDRELLIPFVDAIYRKVDIAERRIEVVLPEGLLDL